MKPGFALLRLVQLRLVPLRGMLKDLSARMDGQDLVEYALMVALIALGAAAAMSTVAVAVSKIFTSLGNLITSNIT